MNVGHVTRKLINMLFFSKIIEHFENRKILQNNHYVVYVCVCLCGEITDNKHLHSKLKRYNRGYNEFLIRPRISIRFNLFESYISHQGSESLINHFRKRKMKQFTEIILKKSFLFRFFSWFESVASRVSNYFRCRSLKSHKNSHLFGSVC